MTDLTTILERIRMRSEEYLNIYSSSNIPHPTPRLISLSVDLPEIPSLLPGLLGAGAGMDLATKMDRSYQSRAAELRSHIEKVVAKATIDGSSLPDTHLQATTSKINALFVDIFMRQLSRWRDEAISMFLERRQSCQLSAPKDRGQRAATTFNHDYVPLLEHFFDENPFPSHADKVFLAKKSGMTYKQIHVWFQNRRNRIKKEKKPLRKKPMAEGATLPLDPLYQRMKKYMVIPGSSTKQDHPQREQPPKNHLKGDCVSDSSKSLLDTPAPPHAFPSVYPPPTSSYSPFPVEGGSRFGEPQWIRRCQTTFLRPRPDNDIAALIDQFSQLHVRDDSTIRMRKQHASKTRDPGAAVCAVTVIPSPAPHPALIRRPLAVVTTVDRLPTVSASKSSLHVFKTPSPEARPATLVPASHTASGKTTSSKRKVAPLPHRFPRNAHRAVTPAASEASSSPTPPSSRSLSCCSTESLLRTASLDSSSSFGVEHPLSPTSEVGDVYRALQGDHFPDRLRLEVENSFAELTATALVPFPSKDMFALDAPTGTRHPCRPLWATH
ncbi:hypothetical protein PAXINDRAFT_6211 [Paxillus involutus ATCC 200175]|nr:hypothetical protein PAXINDRAFT_6211 [Paxillus involutus ATCC 200175]